MAKKTNDPNPVESRIEIPYFEGLNTAVAPNISKKQELDYIENARSTTIGIIEKRQGTSLLGNQITATANLDMMYFENSGANKGFFRVSTSNGATNIYYLSNANTWATLTGLGTNLSAAANYLHTMAEGCCFLVNGDNNNIYISSDGVTVLDSSTTSSHLYNSPKAKKINYYKDKLYIADFTIGAVRYRNSVMMSSIPLGTVALLSGDSVAGATSLDVTDTKYIRASDTLDVYRGGTLIETITVTGKADYTIAVVATSNAFLSADELWVSGTFTGAKKFRWPDNYDTGAVNKQYDTFKLSGGQNDAITMLTNIGNTEVISNKTTMAVWNDYNLRNLDMGIGCVSDRGWLKLHDGKQDNLFFIAYNGIYQMGSGSPQLISAKVEKYFTGATKAGLEGAAMGKKGLSIFCSISGTVTLYDADGSVAKTLTGVVLEKNLKTGNWYVHTGIVATQFQTFVDTADADRLIFASTITGYHLFEFLTGETDDLVTTTREIPMRIDFADITLMPQFEKVAYPVQIVTDTERGANMTCFVSLDGEQFYQLEGDVQKGCSILKVHGKDKFDGPSPRVRKISVSLRDNSKQLCRISRMAIIYNMSIEEEEPQRA